MKTSREQYAKQKIQKTFQNEIGKLELVQEVERYWLDIVRPTSSTVWALECRPNRPNVTGLFGVPGRGSGWKAHVGNDSGTWKGGRRNGLLELKHY